MRASPPTPSPGDATSGDVVKFRRLPSNPDLPLPSRATDHAAGYDLRSAEPELRLGPGERRLVATGLEMEMPPGMECQIRPRSGLALRHGVTVANSPGTIDPDYRGEIKVILHNAGQEPVSIRRGDRVAQMVFAHFRAPEIVEVEGLSGSDRGSGGFGSTGST